MFHMAPVFRVFHTGAGENTLRRLALFVYLDHPTKNDVTSSKGGHAWGKKMRHLRSLGK